MSNRDHILDLALRLFNERGSHAVTTNDLANELGISVGNLYYHFRNKEEIIRAVFERMNTAWETRLNVPDPDRPTSADIDALIGEHFRVLWEFRFFYREQSSLRQRDPMLARRWTVVHQRGRDDLRPLLAAAIDDAGARHPPTPERLETLIDACWIIADYWLPYVESCGGQLRSADLDRGVEFFRTVTHALITARPAAAPLDRPSHRQ